jgi:small subunit ribosomal protein S20
MANTKSAKKQIKKNIKRYHINLARKTAIKTAIKKFLLSLTSNSLEESNNLLKDVSSKLHRAKGKGLIHKNNASRKLSRLTKKLNAKRAQIENSGQEAHK